MKAQSFTEAELTTLDFTAAEIAFVLREPIKAVKKALDEGPIETKLVSRSGAAVRAVGWVDLIYLFAAKTLCDDLTPKARKQLHSALARGDVDRSSEVRIGPIRIAIDGFRSLVVDRARELAALGEQVEFRSDGGVLVRGTDVEVHRIAALLQGGMSAAEICGDYPSLTLRQIADAGAYAEAHPKTGRPYSKISLKRAMRNAGLEALDDVFDRA